VGDRVQKVLAESAGAAADVHELELSSGVVPWITDEIITCPFHFHHDVLVPAGKEGHVGIPVLASPQAKPDRRATLSSR